MTMRGVRSQGAQAARLCLLGASAVVGWLACSSLVSSARPALVAGVATTPPNIVLMVADDLGYGDLGAYGAKGYATPRLDRLAAEGVRFTSFYAAQAVCSSSRAALLTGSYATRVSVQGAFMPSAETGLHPDEITLAELLKPRGVAAGLLGKWHLGHHEPFLPPAQGFDEYFGLPYSNDMWPRHPTITGMPPLPLMDGTRVVARDPDQALLTSQLTERAVRFIERHRERPFLLVLAHPMPHVPLHAGARVRGTTSRGLYGDVVAEIDWSAGEVLDALERTGIADRTLVLFTSDNGPWLSYGDHAGSAGPFREGKGTTFEGGVRVPAIARWPGRIPPGRVVDDIVTMMDVYATAAAAVDVPLPAGRIIDGRDFVPLARGESAGPLHEAFYYYWNGQLQAVRSGAWKLHAPHAYQALDVTGRDGRPGRYVERRIGAALYDLVADPGESRDVAARHPEIVRRLEALMERARGDLGDALRGRAGANVRPAGVLPSNAKS